MIEKGFYYQVEERCHICNAIILRDQKYKNAICFDCMMERKRKNANERNRRVRKNT